MINEDKIDILKQATIFNLQKDYTEEQNVDHKD